MAGHVEHVVDPTQQPVITLVVTFGAIASEVAAREAAPVLGLVALGIPPDGARHSRPRPLQDEITAAAKRDTVAVFVEHVRLDGRERERRRAWLAGGDAGQRR